MARTIQVLRKRQARCPTEKALHEAIKNNSPRAMRMLTRFPELDVNKPVKGATALICSCIMGRLSIVQILLKKRGTNVNAWLEKDGSTALMIACTSKERNSTEIVKLLLTQANINLNAISQDVGYTALMYAARKGHADVVKALISRPRLDVNSVSKEGKTALMYAAKAAYLPVVESLLKHPRINAALTDKEGKTALDLAVEPEVQELLQAHTLTSDAEDESEEESEEEGGGEEGNEGGGSLDSSSDEDADAEEEKSRIVSSAGSNESNTRSASSSSSSSSSDSDTDHEIAMPAQVGGSSATSRIADAQQARAPAPERTWLAVRLLEAGYGEQDVTICERRLIHEQRFVSEAVYGMSISLDDAVLLSIGIKQLGLRVFLLDLQRVLHSKRSVVMVEESRATKRQRSE